MKIILASKSGVRKQILDKHKVLVKYCSLPHDTRSSWCRMTIQPDMTSRPFFRELVNEQ